MEYFPSQDLKAWAAEGKLNSQLILRAVHSAASALDYAHSQSIVHRDIKPANLLLSDSCELKITDFGIAKSLGDATRTTQGMILGSLEYIAPEQLTAGAVGPATDQYSLAATTYYLLTGQKIFASDSIAEFSYRILHDAPPAVTRIDPTLPPQLDRIFARALAKRPEERFSSCGELAEELNRAFAPRAIPPIRPSPKSSNRLLLAAVFTLTLICAVIAGYFLWPHPKRSSQAESPHESKIDRRSTDAPRTKHAANINNEAPAVGPQLPEPVSEIPKHAAGQPDIAKPAPGKLTDIYFDEGVQKALSEQQLRALRADAEILKSMLQKQPGLTVRVEDHFVSRDRAEFVRQKLIEFGLPGAQLVTASSDVSCESPSPQCGKLKNQVHLTIAE
jgi:serine/threonine protein kinase